MDEGTKPSLNELVITREFNAPRALVFKAWTQPEHVARWWGCDYMEQNKFTNDLRVGGAFKSEMTLEGGALHVISGTYLEIDEPERLQFTWTWRNGPDKGSDSLVTIVLEEKGDGTLMTFRHERFETVEECDSHREGWTASFDRLVGEMPSFA